MISKLKPRNHSSQSMYHLGYLRDIPNTQSEEGTDIPSPVCLFSRVEEAEKNIAPSQLLSFSFPQMSVMSELVCLLPDRILLWKTWCFVQKAFLLLSHMSLGQMDKVNAQMHYQSWKQLKTVFKCIISHILTKYCLTIWLFEIPVLQVWLAGFSFLIPRFELHTGIIKFHGWKIPGGVISSPWRRYEDRPMFSGILILQSSLTINFNGTIIYNNTSTVKIP